MKLSVITLVLDGEPWIEKHLTIFEKLSVDWRWVICHGTSQNKGSTAWCNPQNPRLSIDGTTQYLRSIESNPRIMLIENDQWQSKDDMVNAALNQIDDACILLQIDADEIHTPENLQRIVFLFENDPDLGGIRMRCRYFVGPHLVCRGDNCWSNKSDEWDRAWRFEPGMKFISHEPPILDRMLGRMMDKAEASFSLGITFDHMAYATEAQVKFKEQFYGYNGLVNQWRALQDNQKWPAKLSRFFPFVDDKVEVIKLDG